MRAPSLAGLLICSVAASTHAFARACPPDSFDLPTAGGFSPPTHALPRPLRQLASAAAAGRPNQMLTPSRPRGGGSRGQGAGRRSVRTRDAAAKGLAGSPGLRRTAGLSSNQLIINVLACVCKQLRRLQLSPRSNPEHQRERFHLMKLRTAQAVSSARRQALSRAPPAMPCPTQYRQHCCCSRRAAGMRRGAEKLLKCGEQEAGQRGRGACGDFGGRPPSAVPVGASAGVGTLLHTRDFLPRASRVLYRPPWGPGSRVLAAGGAHQAPG